MATAKKEVENAAVETAAKEEPHESTYSVDEYCKAGVVGVVGGKRYSKDLIKAAFMVAGVKNATPTEAADIVSKFANKEVEN